MQTYREKEHGYIIMDIKIKDAKNPIKSRRASIVVNQSLKLLLIKTLVSFLWLTQVDISFLFVFPLHLCGHSMAEIFLLVQGVKFQKGWKVLTFCRLEVIAFIPCYH